ncbi:MAG: ATP-binding protein [Gemmatimonadales bacterium]|nr:ATP-binding protein [Gemmatimonadales bacterium]
MAHYDPDQGKFQAATSRTDGAVPLWIGAGVVVLVAAESATQASWLWVLAAACASAGLAVHAWRKGGAQGRVMGVALSLLALAQAAGGARMASVALRPAEAARLALADAAASRDRALAAAIASARRAATFAVQRVATASGVPNLDDLVSRRGIERGIVVLRHDSVIAVAGPARIRPVVTTDPAVLTVTPFGHFLTIRDAVGGVEAQVTVLLDASAALPAAGRALLDGAGRWQRVDWAWDAPDGAIVYPSYEAATEGIARAARALTPPHDLLVAREHRLARLIIGLGLVALSVLLLLIAPGPVVRAGALLVPLWAISRVDPSIVTQGPTALQAGAATAALLFVAILIWRRPKRRAPIGVTAAVLLMASAVPMVVIAARELLPHDASTSLTAWFGWQVALAVGTTAYLALANAPLRSGDDADAPAGWGIAAGIVAVAVGAAGIEAWTPSGWPPWYPVLWMVPLAMMLPRMPSPVRMGALATTAGVLATLATWGQTLDLRMDLARADVARLQAPQPDSATAALDAFVVVAEAAHATRIDRLYAAWRSSEVAQLGLPTHLALWSADGIVRESVALDSLSMTWGDLEQIVRAQGVEPRRASLRRGAVHHEVLVLPLAPDTIATVTTGARSRVVAPTRFGRYLGWRTTADPAFQLAVVSERAINADSTFRRAGRWIRAHWNVAAGESPRVVRATIEMAKPRPFIVRAALSVLLDVLIVLAAWLALERLLGRDRTMTVGVLRRSYRRTVATALAAFFIGPALFFTFWSVLRLRGDATVARTAEVTRALRDVALEGGFSLASNGGSPSDSLRRIADIVDADVAIYRDARLVAASTPLLVDLGFLAPVVNPLRAPPGSDAVVVRDILPGTTALMGIEPTDDPAMLVATVLPGTDSGLARDQFDLALLLLLVTLSGAAAAVAVAGLVARALGQPIDTLRRTALAIGRGDPLPNPEAVPAEFAPVFGAIDQMEQQLRRSAAAIESGRARTAAILSTVATGVIGVDESGAVIHANPRAEELLERRIVLGNELREQLPPGWDGVVDGVDRLLGPATPEAESREIAIDDRLLAITLAPLGDGGLVLAITDITAASRAARIVAWGEMARQVAHEIKNPLTPMRLGLQHLRRVHTDQHPEFAVVFDETVTRLLGEIDRLDRIARSFARYGTPPEPTDAALEEIPLRAAVEELAGLFALTSAQPDIKVVGTETVVLARREELVQVLLNLLDNARHAGASNVSLTVSEAGLDVVDNGRGIPAEQLARIFEPTFSTTTSGTGLGLAIVRRLVEGWGATIEPGEPLAGGARFAIRFRPAGAAFSTTGVPTA